MEVAVVVSLFLVHLATIDGKSEISILNKKWFQHFWLQALQMSQFCFTAKKIEKQILRGYTLHPSSEHLTPGLRLNISKAKITITS